MNKKTSPHLKLWYQGRLLLGLYFRPIVPTAYFRIIQTSSPPSTFKSLSSGEVLTPPRLILSL